MSAHSQHYIVAPRRTARWPLRAVAFGLSLVLTAAAVKALSGNEPAAAPASELTELTLIRVDAFRAGYTEAIQRGCGSSTALAHPIGERRP